MAENLKIQELATGQLLKIQDLEKIKVSVGQILKIQDLAWQNLKLKD